MTAARALAAGLLLAGVAYRVRDLGRYGFWNDEAWVALSTRVETLDQFQLALGPTPPLWAAALRLVQPIAAPDVSLRLLPFAFGVLTLWAAHRTGRWLAGTLGGLLALAVIAFDRDSIEYSKLLKQYTAETFLALLAFDLGARFTATGRTRDLAGLALTLAFGATVATTQLFVAPPLLAALLLQAVLGRDRRRAAAVAVAAALVAAWQLAYFRLQVAPHLTTALGEYWQAAYVPTAPWPALRFVGRTLAGMVADDWSRASLILAVVALPVLLAGSAPARPLLVATVLLFSELAALSAFRLVPFDAPRVLLFLRTILHVVLAAAVAAAVDRLWSRRRLRPVAVLVLAVVIHGLVAGRAWSTLGYAQQVEDLGPLVRLAEAGRQPGDAVLVYARSLYVYAYYRTRPPVLVPAPTTVGFVPRLDDPAEIVIDGPDARAAVARAFDGHARVWFLGSRFQTGDDRAIRRELLARGRFVDEVARPRALLLLAVREP